MDGAIVFRKTRRGASEPQTRGLGLSTAARQLLILVDGARSVADLSLLLQSAPVPQLLVDLLALGLIASARRGTGEHPTAEPALLPGRKEAPEAGGPLALARSRLLGELHKTLGADAELAAPGIAACASIPELAILAARLRDLVEAYAGEERGAQYIEQLAHILARSP